MIDLKPTGTGFGSELPQQTIIISRGRFRFKNSEIYPPSPHGSLTHVSHIYFHESPNRAFSKPQQMAVTGTTYYSANRECFSPTLDNSIDDSKPGITKLFKLKPFEEFTCEREQMLTLSYA
ncbi:hypothetical protein EMIT0P395_20397 [Pseudomonas sp. IT-P395]